MNILIICLLSFATVTYAQDSTAADTTTRINETGQGSLVVVLTGMPNNDGLVMVALSNSQEDYEQDGKPYIGLSAPVTNNRAQVMFESLAYGIYAIKVFHDEDEDEELDTNILGIPSEAYGFSNNAAGTFGPAAWEDAKFTFAAESDTLFIGVD